MNLKQLPTVAIILRIAKKHKKGECKKEANLVSRVLFPKYRDSIIYLALQSLIGSINLPIAVPDKSGEDEQPSAPATYLVFQHTRFTVMHVTIQDRELLPHVFTLTPTNRGGIFSVALSVSDKPEPSR